MCFQISFLKESKKKFYFKILNTSDLTFFYRENSVAIRHLSELFNTIFCKIHLNQHFFFFFNFLILAQILRCEKIASEIFSNKLNIYKYYHYHKKIFSANNPVINFPSSQKILFLSQKISISHEKLIVKKVTNDS